MKTHGIKPYHGAALTALALGLASFSHVYGQIPHYGQTSQTSIQTLTPDAETFALSKISGQPLQSASGEELGTVSDFLIEPQSGAVHFAVVPSGTGPGGETYRLVPLGAIDANAPGALKVQIDRAQWDRVGTLVERRLQGRIALDADLQQRVAQQFNMGNQVTASAELIRASQLKGQPVRSANEQLGTIEDVLIDTRHKVAAVVLTPNNAFAGGAQRFMVPFQQLQFTGDAQAGVTTTLSRSQFQQQASSSLSPTGYSTTSAPFTQASQQAFGAGGQQPVAAAAAAVQQAISRDQAAAGVQVVPESRIVLRGSVDNQQKKLDIERTAVQAAPGVPIDNQITVRRW